MISSSPQDSKPVPSQKSATSKASGPKKPRLKHRLEWKWKKFQLFRRRLTLKLRLKLTKPKLELTLSQNLHLKNHNMVLANSRPTPTIHDS